MIRWGLVAAIAVGCGGKSDTDEQGERVSDALLSCLEPTVWYKDVDVDGFGATDSAYIGPACPHPPLHTRRSGDCDDQAAATNPGAVEICDGVDNNCDGLTDDADPSVVDAQSYFVDADDDGYGAGPAVAMACAPPSQPASGDKFAPEKRSPCG